MKKLRVIPPQMPTLAAEPPSGVSAALELEFHRKRLGLTQAQLGALAGLSQPQIANAIQGRFGLSFAAATRIKAVLLAPERLSA